MLVDYEALVLDLEEYLQSKNSHGQRDLLAKLAELRAEHRIKEGAPERALRLWSAEFEEVLDRARSQPTSNGHARAAAHG